MGGGEDKEIEKEKRSSGVFGFTWLFGFVSFLLFSSSSRKKKGCKGE